MSAMQASLFQAPVAVPSLRPYQEKAIADLYKLIDKGHSKLLFVAPTGSGKTIVLSRLIVDAIAQQKRCLLLVHRDVLIQQTLDKLSMFGVYPGVIKAGYKEDRSHLIQVASVQTLCRREWPEADIVLHDESHIVSWSNVGRSLLSDYNKAIHIGVTATPWRLSKREGMGDLFEKLVAAPMPHALIEQGFLVPVHYFGFAQGIDLSAVKTIAGDYSDSDLAIACDKPELVGKLVSEWKRLCDGRRTIAFAVNVQHSKHICNAFNSAGIPAAHVDGTTPTSDRNRIYQQLASGEILVLSSCQALQEGFDVVEVSAILLCRPTKSKALHFQQVGRGLRIAPHIGKQNCMVLDQAGNVQRFGFIEELKQVRLTNGKESDPQPAPTKVCANYDPEVEEDGCGAIVLAFAKACPHCGFKFPTHKEERTDDFVALLSKEDKGKLKFFHSKLREAFDRGFAPGYAGIKFKEEYSGDFPPNEWMQHAVLGKEPSRDAIANYIAYLWKIADKKDKGAGWVKYWLSMELGVIPAEVEPMIWQKPEVEKKVIRRPMIENPFDIFASISINQAV